MDPANRGKHRCDIARTPTWASKGSTWISQLPGRHGASAGDKANVYDHIAFDLNGIVHQACRKRGNEREVIKAVIGDLMSYSGSFPPARPFSLRSMGPDRRQAHRTAQATNR